MKSDRLNLDELAILLGVLNPLGNDGLEELLLLGFQRGHVESDGHLSLGLCRIVGHGNVASMSVAGCHLGNEEAGLLGIVNGIGEQTGHLLRGMEGGTVGSDGIVPAPLALTEQRLNGLHLGLAGTLVDDKLSLEVGTGQLLLGAVAHLGALLLTLVDVLAQHLGILAVAGLAGAVDIGQRRHDVVVGEFHTTLALVRHVAVGTAHAALGMDALLGNLIARVLSLQDRRLRQRVDIVVETNLVVPFLSILAGKAVVLREVQVVGLLVEVILGVALCADQRAHLLVAGFLHVLAGAGPCLVEG